MSMHKIHSESWGLSTSEVHYDSDEDRLVTSKVVDLEPLLNLNKAEYNGDHKFRSETMNKVASIPLIIVEKWLKEGLNIFQNDPETQKKLREKLNSNEYRYLRTRPGRI